jgi:hypothetical protein
MSDQNSHWGVPLDQFLREEGIRGSGNVFRDRPTDDDPRQSRSGRRSLGLCPSTTDSSIDGTACMKKGRGQRHVNPHWSTMPDQFLIEEGIREAAKAEALTPMEILSGVNGETRKALRPGC